MAISKKLQGESEDFDRWKIRVNTYKEWKQKHKLTLCKVGEKIDVRDTEYIWCVAILELKITSLNH